MLALLLIFTTQKLFNHSNWSLCLAFCKAKWSETSLSNFLKSCLMQEKNGRVVKIFVFVVKTKNRLAALG